MHQGIIAIFKLEYMRKPTVDDVQHIIEMHEDCGFLGMLGSVDYMH